jgi:hypothetical protein
MMMAVQDFSLPERQNGAFDTSAERENPCGAYFSFIPNFIRRRIL